MSAFKRGVSIFIVFLCFNVQVCFASAIMPIQQIIRVGCWVENDYLCSQKADGSKQGYIPDYLQKLNHFMDISAGRYRYSYHFGTPEQLEEKLRAGDLDLIVGYPYHETEGLVKSSCITDIQLTLSTSKQNNHIFYKDAASLNGLKIGYTMDHSLDIITRYETENGIDLIPIFYKDPISLRNDLSANRIELAMLPLYENEDRFKVVDFLDTIKLFFITTDTNQALLKRLDQAKHKLQVAFPSYEDDLRQKHAKGISYALANTKEEEAFLNANEPIQFAVSSKTDLIQYDEKSNEFVGPYAALIDYFSKVYGLNYEIIFADGISESIEQGADVLLGMVESPQIAKRYNLVFSEPYLHGIYSYWSDNGKKIDFKIPNNVGTIHNLESVQSYIQNFHPQWNLTMYDSLEQCVKAVEDGSVDFMMLDDIVDGAHYELLETLDRLYDSDVPQLDVVMGINIRKKNGPVILGLMNRAIMGADSEKISTIMLNNKVPNYDFQSILKRYYRRFIWLTQLFIMLVLLVVEMHCRRLHQAAYIDKELKMNNRNYLLHYGGKFAKENTSTIVLDIAKLKQINMLLGIPVGDDIRIFVANVLKKCKKKGVFLAQTSSLNYAIILPYAEKEQINLYLKDVFSKLKEYQHEIFSVSLEFHVGVYQSYCQEEIQTNLGKAELALFEAKRKKTRVYFYSEDIENRIRKEKMLDRKMHKALENAEFEMYLQPQYESKTGKISGAEALVRWKEADGKIIYPNDFIPYFEQNGFILKLDDYMFAKACKLQRSLLDQGIHPVPIAVNQSRQHANDDGYSERLKAIADRYGVAYNLIELEVTEYIYGNEKKILEAIDNLKKIGFSISIDDFGSGYSSLNMLGGEQVDCIKIDKQFLKEGFLTQKTKQVLTAIVSIAKSLNIQCVCEGVETKQQVEFLREINCTYLQGFYFSKPVEVEHFLELAYDIEKRRQAKEG